MVTMIIPCAGRASRMGALDVPKCLLPIGGVPILQRLVTESFKADLGVRVVARPDDHHIEQWAAQQDYTIEITRAPFESYGTTLLRAAGTETEVAAADGDLILPDGELTLFLKNASRSSAQLVLGVTRWPLDLGPRTIWWSPTPMSRTGRDLDDRTSRLVGVYWLREPAMRSLKAFVETGRTSFAQFLSTFAGAELEAIDFSSCFNINTPQDMADAIAAHAGSAA